MEDDPGCWPGWDVVQGCLRGSMMVWYQDLRYWVVDFFQTLVPEVMTN